MKIRLLRVGLWLTSLLLLTVITALSLIPQPVVVWDKLAHAAAYAVLLQSVLLAAVWAPGLGEGRWPEGHMALVIAAICFGAVIEILQGAYFARTPDALDAASNALGALIGAAAWYGLRRTYGLTTRA